MKKVEIKPLDVLFFRDSRPMGGSFKGRGENFPMPHTFNGALRSAIQSDGTDFFTVGPFLKKSDEIYFQTPGDLILNGSNSNNSESSNVMRISPLEGNYYTNLPNGMKPIGSSGIVETKEKLGNFISSSDFEKYLRNESLNPSSFKTNSDFYAIENNFGIAIDKLTNIAVEQKFFTKNTIRLKDNVSFVGLMRDSKDYPEHTYIRFGGEARYSDCRVEDISKSILPVPPEITGNRVKFVLLTPAIFVQQQDQCLLVRIYFREQFIKFFPDLFRSSGDIRHSEYDVGFGDFLPGAFDADFFDGFGGFPDSCSVYEPEQDAVYVQGFFNSVAGGSVDIRDDGPVFSEKGIEQGAFACVGGSGNGYRDSVFDGIAQTERVDQPGNVFHYAVEKRI